MIYTLTDRKECELVISHENKDKKATIFIQQGINLIEFELEKDVLNELIGTLLHIQAKIRKGGNNE